MREALHRILLALLVMGWTAECPAQEKINRMLAMSDGVKLDTDIYLPKGDGPYPVIMFRSPYGKDRFDPSQWLRQGYVLVGQDMRGRFKSGGGELPFSGCGWSPHHDGADTIAWLLEQDWCNGKIGTLGSSAGGITQYLLAGAKPKVLTCQMILDAAPSLYHHAAYVGGAFCKSQVEAWLACNEFHDRILELYRSHPGYDEFWRNFDSLQKCKEITAPGLHVGGWYDLFALGTIEGFTSRQYLGGPGAKDRQMLVMGPWRHGGYVNGGKVGDLTFSNSRTPRGYDAEQWFDHHLKGKKNGIEDLPSVAYYVMGDAFDEEAPGKEWRFSDIWPVSHEPWTFYLHADSRLTRDKPENGTPYRAFRFDPSDPCPTVGGCNLALPAGPMDQRFVEERSDTISFTTDLLVEPIEVTGRIKAFLHLSSSTVDTDLSVRFCDVYPGGKSYLMAEGMLRVRYRGGFEKAVLMEPDKVYSVEIDLWPTSVVVNKGHRMRVTITSSNFPRFDLNPGTGAVWSDDGKAIKQGNRIHCSKRYPSHFIFPAVTQR